ncbi:MAG: hypothetical protein M0Q91_12145 [Methanoregula sp.]|jgi:hypothetical protein|nr:hypothetical protein [Methanoregula sp.]
MNIYIPSDEEREIIFNGLPKGYEDCARELANDDGYYALMPGLECDVHLRRIERYPYCKDGKFHVKIAYSDKWIKKGYESKEIENVDVHEVNKLMRRYLLDEKV